MQTTANACNKHFTFIVSWKDCLKKILFLSRQHAAHQPTEHSDLRMFFFFLLKNVTYVQGFIACYFQQYIFTWTVCRVRALGHSDHNGINLQIELVTNRQCGWHTCRRQNQPVSEIVRIVKSSQMTHILNFQKWRIKTILSMQIVSFEHKCIAEEVWDIAVSSPSNKNNHKVSKGMKKI